MPMKETAYQLTENEIHLWIINPQQINATAVLRAILSLNEQQKVDRYRSDKAKHTALITRAFIRLLLSQYESLSPQQWQFSVSELGKPEVKNATLPLRFNLSHNDEMIICAICLEKDIGCDIENLSRKISVNAIAKRFFSAQEYQLIKATPTRFFEYWTLKEAFVKATGLGISQGLDTFSFEIKTAKEKDRNDNISLTFNENCREKTPQDWYHTLLFPDNKHCIGLSLNQKKKTDKRPLIRLFSVPQSTSLFNR
ncbi:4'-phosphopantetheinyl transferase family protein [Psychromonas hadalis]|uniref:4'-phosphopantetheinyl transferase family protein n=1 Tax=Psychromonas hadalis TaxID=211669 RepID=UPI0003B68D89|nr:4'-phosphopantetheinyl transferase superfamily protein [Psychromonas hadalis]